MYKSYLLLFCMVILMHHKVLSQITVNHGQVISFNESSGLRAGVVKTSIPLFEINAGSLHIPVSITYTMEPLKRRSFPGLVGEGWYFDMQHFLTYTTRDKNDIYNNPLNIDTIAELQGSSSWHYERDMYLRELEENTWMNPTDTEVDYLTYNLPGLYGKFYYDRQTEEYEFIEGYNANFHFEPYWDESKDSLYFYDDKGRIFTFDRYNGHSDYDNASDFYIPLSRIKTTYSNDSILIRVEKKQMLKIFKQPRITVQEPFQPLYHYEFAPNFFTSDDPSWWLEEVRDTASIHKQIDTVYQAHISYPTRVEYNGGYIDFTYLSGDSYQLIQTIQIWNQTWEMIRKINFEYDFKAVDSPFLSSVTINDKETYTMGYYPVKVIDTLDTISYINLDELCKTENIHGETIFPMKGLQDFYPPYFYHNDLEWWSTFSYFSFGDFNPYNNEIISSGILSTDYMGWFYHEDVAKNPSNLMLSHITNPYGGRQEFEYENHPDYSFNIFHNLNGHYYTHPLKYPPGIRIKSVRTFDNDGQLVSRQEYTYGHANIEESTPYPWDRYLRHRALIRMHHDEFFTATKWHLANLITTFGAPNGSGRNRFNWRQHDKVYYDSVAVMSYDGSGPLARKISYYKKLNIPDSQLNPFMPSYARIPQVFNDTFTSSLGVINRRGIQGVNERKFIYNDLVMLDKEVVYEPTSGNTFRKRKEELYTYGYDPSKFKIIKNFYFERFALIPEYTGLNPSLYNNIYVDTGIKSLFDYQDYYIFYNKFNLLSKETKIFNYSD